MGTKAKVGQRLRALRSDRDRTQQQLADRTSLTRHAVAQVERGERHLKAGELRECANALDASYDVLLDGPTDRPDGKQRVDFPRLDELGLSDEQQKALNDVIADGHGLILNTGPAGSGTTTTLYACLAARMGYAPNSRHMVVTTEPLEYTLPTRDGEQLKHLQYGEDELSEFTKGILHRDYDTILVDEIRDDGMAQQVIRAVLAGKLVIASIHASRAHEAVERLEAFGVSKQALRDTLRVEMAQRLHPVLCEYCKKPLQDPTIVHRVMQQAEGLGMLGEVPDQLCRRGDGCEACSGLGVSGQAILAELYQHDHADESEQLPETYRGTRTVHLDSDDFVDSVSMRTSIRPGSLEGHALQKIFDGVCDPGEIDLI